MGLSSQLINVIVEYNKVEKLTDFTDAVIDIFVRNSIIIIQNVEASMVVRVAVWISSCFWSGEYKLSYSVAKTFH